MMAVFYTTHHHTRPPFPTTNGKPPHAHHCTHTTPQWTARLPTMHACFHPSLPTTTPLPCLMPYPLPDTGYTPAATCQWSPDLYLQQTLLRAFPARPALPALQPCRCLPYGWCPLACYTLYFIPTPTASVVMARATTDISSLNVAARTKCVVSAISSIQPCFKRVCRHMVAAEGRRLVNNVEEIIMSWRGNQ